MEWWAFIWIGISFAIFISVLESIHRTAKRRRAAAREEEAQSQIRQQQFHVYTIQSSNVSHLNNSQDRTGHPPHVHVKFDDLPPKYDDVVSISTTTYFPGTTRTTSTTTTTTTTAL